ncbi:MAG: hypothetical protein ACI3W6_07320 [Clostridia bacterium]
MAEPNFSDVFEEESLAEDSLAESQRIALENETKDRAAENTEVQNPEKVEDVSVLTGSAEAARKEAQDAAEKEMDELFRDAGMVNPYTNEAIRSKADFLAWKKRYQEDSAAAEKKNFNAPGEHGELQGETRKRVEQKVQRELEKIRRWDDGVQSLEDIADSENFAAIYGKVMRGYDLSDAVYLANAEKYQRRAAERAEQTAINRLRSKEHLVGVGPRGGGETVVPRDVMAEFKRLMPKASGEEIRKFYRRDQAHLKK